MAAYSRTREGNATLSLDVLGGKVDPSKWGTKVYVEARLGDLVVHKLSPVEVDPVSGDFSYDGAVDKFADFNDHTLEEIYDETLHIVLRSWSPVSSFSGWVDSAQIRISVRSISIDTAVVPIDSDRDGGNGDRGELEYMLFRLEPVEGVVEDFQTENENIPNLVLSATLRSPFRPPVESVARLLQGCASTVDFALETVSQQTDRVAPYLTRQAALVPRIPAGVLVLASLPLVFVLGVAGLPLLLPILVVVTLLGSVGALLAAILWVFSRGGRSWVQGVVQPVCERIGREDPEVLYPVGPIPSPARIARSLVPTGMWSKLVLSIVVDTIGCTSYIVPVLGESADLMWAPVSYLLIDAMYHYSSPWAGVFGAMEELLPFTDIIPTATLAWMKENLPLLLHDLHRAARTGTNHGGPRHQQQRGQGSVYHSNENVGTGGVHYPSQPADER